MADLGDIMGSLMCGLIRARRMADEQTAGLAEYYKSQPLLEGLSVPRIRIPEITIDVPMLLEDQQPGQTSAMADVADITRAASSQIESSFTKQNVTVPSTFHKAFDDEFGRELKAIKTSDAPVTRESVARIAQKALTNTLSSHKIEMPKKGVEAVSSDLRNAVSAVSLSREAIPSQIMANVRTADVKEKAASTNVVRLTMTLKEEGLEWSVAATEDGGTHRTLQPE